MTGAVIADKPVKVPLFGPPHQVMLSNVMINRKPAVVGFEGGDHYFVRTDEERFLITGDMSLKGELSFTIPGPLNIFTALLTDGRVVEGDRLSGLHDSTVHLEVGKAAEQPEAELPPIFQVSRAVRIQKEISFEYRVTVRSGAEVSSVTIPLLHQEMVLDVPGHKGWKQENSVLVVPTSGRSIQFTVHGRMPEVGVFSPDDRSSYEWWLIESDAEHRVKVKTSARQVDSGESPIQRQMTSARLYLVMKGQKLDVSVKALAGVEALAVVISSQSRRIIWTKREKVPAAEAGLGQRASVIQQQRDQTIFLGNVPYAEIAAVKSVTPVALPMPSYERSVNVSRELVIKERPLAPTLVYVTSAALWPLVLVWLGCLVFSGIQLWPRARETWNGVVRFWRKKSEPPPKPAGPEPRPTPDEKPQQPAQPPGKPGAGK